VSCGLTTYANDPPDSWLCMKGKKKKKKGEKGGRGGKKGAGIYTAVAAFLTHRLLLHKSHEGEKRKRKEREKKGTKKKHRASCDAPRPFSAFGPVNVRRKTKERKREEKKKRGGRKVGGGEEPGNSPLWPLSTQSLGLTFSVGRKKKKKKKECKRVTESRRLAH